jgi:transcriptional regulator with XRE-family HTH domain
LAERGDFNRTYVSDLERGIKQPSLFTIVRLSYALKIKPSELLEKVEKNIEIK